VQVNYHRLSDFRVAHAALDEMLNASVASPMTAGTVKSA
jgi:hypothetical protein